MINRPILEMKGLSYSYSKHYFALKDISVAIYPGEKIAVLGNNGAGKSTFFLCCNGVLKPNSGELVLEGERIGKKKKDLMRLREAVGLVFQDPDDQIVASTVEAEVSFGPLNMGCDDKETEIRITESLERMNLEEYRQRVPHYLSGGEKKQVTIADILAMRPNLILFDEPTSSLDPQNTQRLMEILEGLSNEGMTMMVATHDLDFAYTWADRIIVFSGGEIIGDGPSLEIFSNEAMLTTAGLHKPTLYAVAQMLCNTFGTDLSAYPPKSIAELQTFINSLRE